MTPFLQRLVRRLWRQPFIKRLVSLAGRYARVQRLLTEEIVTHDIHRFDRCTWVIKEMSGAVRIWCSLDDQAISRPILLNCYEPAETEFVKRNLRPGELAVDAGANIGYYTLLFARLVDGGGCVEAFEPLPYLAEALTASVEENRFEPRVNVHRLALDEKRSIVNIRHAPKTANFGGALITKGSS